MLPKVSRRIKMLYLQNDYNIRFQEKIDVFCRFKLKIKGATHIRALLTFSFFDQYNYAENRSEIVAGMVELLKTVYNNHIYFLNVFFILIDISIIQSNCDGQSLLSSKSTSLYIRIRLAFLLGSSFHSRDTPISCSMLSL